MQQNRTFAAVPILATVICLTAPCAYLAAYFCLGDSAPVEGIARELRGGQIIEHRQSHGSVRVYRTELEALLFQPAAWLESLGGVPVRTRRH